MVHHPMLLLMIITKLRKCNLLDGEGLWVAVGGVVAYVCMCGLWKVWLVWICECMGGVEVYLYGLC